jgi:hypothetical protein
VDGLHVCLNRLFKCSLTRQFFTSGTTDAILLERPSCYDLLIDLTTSTPDKATRPTFYASKLVSQAGPSSRPTHRLSVIRFAWSDVRLVSLLFHHRSTFSSQFKIQWNELERILQLDASNFGSHPCCGPSLPVDPSLKAKLISPWTDVWRVYEDVCIICAGLWIGSWRNNPPAPYSCVPGSENWGSVRLEGDDDLNIPGEFPYVRNLGMGIEGRPSRGASESSSSGSRSHNKSQPSIGHGSPPQSPGATGRAARRTSAVSWSSGRTTAVGSVGNGKAKQASTSSRPAESVEITEAERRDRQLLTTLSLLQTFHAHTSFQLSILESFLPPADLISSAVERTIYLSPKDILAFELGPLSGSDARYLEWLAQEYASFVKIVVKRGLKDLLGVIFGYA